jgi:hypothetical protein
LVDLFAAWNATVAVPQGIPTGLCYALFTWNSIGIVDQQSMLNLDRETWLRHATTIVRYL